METKPLFDLQNKVAIVTGASQGIGFSLAETLADYGVNIVMVSRREAEGKKAAEKISERGVECLYFSADVSKKADVMNMVKVTSGHFPTIDILINSAGVNIRKPVLEFEEKEWDQIMDINLKGTFLCCQQVGKIMVQQKKGKIINISSISALTALWDRGVYATSKGGVSQLTKALALEWGPHGVNVNAIAPGVIVTPLTEKLLQKGSEQYEKHMRKIPMGRFGKPGDLQGCAVFLASGASDYITGQTIYIDGGWTIW
jgi:NAD(P)-dependent dehydrogenase (short-subunit alcohol dehydrogenase family)